MNKLKGKGQIPDNCPKCKAKKVLWNWGDSEDFDEEHTHEVECPECNTIFIEISEVVSWEIQE